MSVNYTPIQASAPTKIESRRKIAISMLKSMMECESGKRNIHYLGGTDPSTQIGRAHV